MKKKYQITLVVIGCLIAILGLSYAYFVATSSGGGAGGTAQVQTYTIEDVGFNIEGVMEFNDLDVLPGHKNISKIKATAVGNNDIINYKLIWEGTNTLNTPLKYYVYKTTSDETASITCNKETEIVGGSKYYYETCTNNSFDNLGTIINEGEITKTENLQEFTLATNEVIKGTETGEALYYYVVLEYPNLDESQNIDMGGKFEGKVTVKKDEESNSDLTIKKIYQQTDTGYEEINRMPSKGYALNSEKSSCTNNATPIAKNNKILITNLTSSNTECNIYFDRDNENPIITSITPSAGETEITVTVNATDNIGVTEYYYQIDEQEPIKETTNTYTFTRLQPKTTHTIKVYVKDSSGNTSEIKTSTVTTVDITKPEITNVTSTPTMTELRISVDATDNVGVTEYWFSIDDNEFIKEESNTHTFTNLEVNTNHTIKVYVKDESGNTSDTITKTFNTEPDSEKPVISNVTTNATETEISVTIEGTDNVGITEYYYQIDNNTPVKLTTNTHTFTGLTANTNHTINVYVKDAAGNTSDTTTRSVTTPDTTKPTISNIATSGTETEINVTVTATDNVGVTEYYFAIDNSTFSKSLTNTFKFAGLKAGITHTIKVYVKDAAGNVSETSTKSVTTPDTTNPIIDNLTTSVTETEINVVVSATDNTEITEYWYAIDTESFTKGTGNTHKFTGLQAKTTHTVKAYVKDKFGNQSETLTTTATTIDDTKPVINKVTSSVTMTEITVTVDATDNVGVTEYWYKIDSGSFTKGTGNTKTFTGLGINSSHTIDIYVKDSSGNQSETSSNVIVTAPDSVKPTISNVTTSVTETEISVTVTASDNVGVTEYWYQLDSNTAVKGSGNTHKFTGLTGGSTHTIKVYVKDAAGNQSDTTTKSNVTTVKMITIPDIIASVNPKTTTPTFSNTATTDEGVYAVNDGMYGGTSYYWRGAVTNNYVTFAGKCWRIVRINGDKSMRLIYDGTTCHENGAKTSNSSAYMNVKYNLSYDQSNYAGWTYTGTSQRTTSGTDSNAKTRTEAWYSSNIGNNTTYASKVADGKYCNDRNVSAAPSSWGSEYVTTWSINGTSFAYAGAKRLYTDYQPTLNCPSGDVYTLKVGLITADEVEFAGGTYSSNTAYYLYNGQAYWTMTPNSWRPQYIGSGTNVGLKSSVFYVGNDGYLGGNKVNMNTSGYTYQHPDLRPVINLKSDTKFSSGNGTLSSPYVVS